MPTRASDTRLSMDDLEREYAELRRAARALLEWEREIADIGFPEAQLIQAPAAEKAPAAQAEISQQMPGAERAGISQGAESPAPQRPEPGVAAPPRAPAEPQTQTSARPRLSLLEEKRLEVEACRACALAEGRTKTVFSRGREDARIMMIGEGPGEKEDLSGQPFVGPAGQLLDRMIAAMGLERDEVYICNIVKCRPPKNRAPHPDEVEACRHFLDAQIDAIAPELIIVLGRSAAEALRLIPEGGGWRGRFASYRGRTTLSTFHPSFLLRSPEQKRVAWADLKEALAFLGLPVPR